MSTGWCIQITRSEESKNSDFEEYQGARADEGTSPGAAFQANSEAK